MHPQSSPKWWVADFETTTANTLYYRRTQDVCLTLGGLLDATGRHYFEYLDVAGFFRLLQTRGIRTCFFHNLSFDGNFVIKWAMQNGWKWANGSRGLKPLQFCPLTDGRAIIYCADFRHPSGARTRLMCSYRILSASVEALGKGLKLEKYAGIKAERRQKFYDVEPQNRADLYAKDYRDYLRRDCDIVRRSLLLHFAEIKDVWRNANAPDLFGKRPDDKLTAGGLSYFTQEAYAKKFNPRAARGMKTGPETHRLANQFFFGGFTQFNPIIAGRVYRCDGMSVDRNSMHPASMCGQMPFGEAHDCFKEPPPDDAMVFLRLRVKRAVSRYANIATLANWKKSERSFRHWRYVFELEDFECFYEAQTFAELCRWNRFEDVSVLEAWWMSQAPYLAPFVQDLYAVRLKHKRQGDKARADSLKVILNSAYGKHGERTEFERVHNCENAKQKDVWLQARECVINGEAYHVKPVYKAWDGYGQHLVRVVPKSEPDEVHNKFIACAITSASFRALLQAIRKIGVERFLYCDTDSVYFKNPPKDLAKRIWLDDDALGAWKIEKRFKWIAIKGAKAYMVGNDETPQKWPEAKKADYAHYGGVSKQWLRENLSLTLYTDPFEQMLYQAQLTPLQCKSGIALVHRDYVAKKRHH